MKYFQDTLYELIQKIWYKKSLLRFFLWPFSLIFNLIVHFRKILYRLGLKKTSSFNCPIIIVGNITAGGTGKTPVVIALAHFLRSKGYQPGIISGGYKGKVSSPQLVTQESHPSYVGDEAVLLARRTNCPVVVCSSRTASVDFLLKETSCDIILSDDGLQHLALDRTIEIAVIDSNLQFGNGFLLPAGPLREPVSRLNTVDFCLLNGNQRNINLNLPNQFALQLVADGYTNLKNQTHIPLGLQSERYIDIATDLTGKNLHAVAGIGSPERFFRMLKELKLIFTAHAFPDHYAFSQKDFNFLKKDECVIMTEKDAVKCESFADERYWYMPVNAKLTEDFFITLLKKVNYYDNKSR